MTVLRIAFHAGCFAGGWLAACLLAGMLLPAAALPVLSEKRDYFLSHRTDFDTVFIGSSRVYHGIVPEVFDGAMKAAGQPRRSFNFGMDGVWPPESLFRVREFLRLHSQVRWVFIELLPVNPRLKPENARTLRSISWHDWRHTLLAWRETARTESFTTSEKAGWQVLHAELFLRRLSHLSRGAELLAPCLRPELEKAARKEYALNTQWLDHAGYLPEPATPMTSAAATDLRNSTLAYVQNLPPAALPAHLRDELRDLIVTVRAAGAEPIFFITPSTTRAENFTDLRSQGIDADLISFKDPARFPALYDPALHFDGPHLNERGARELSRLLAEAVAALPTARPR